MTMLLSWSLTTKQQQQPGVRPTWGEEQGLWSSLNKKVAPEADEEVQVNFWRMTHALSVFGRAFLWGGSISAIFRTMLLAYL